MGTTKEKIEKEILEKQKELISAKTEVLNSQRRMEEMYSDMLSALKEYSGQDE